MKSLVVLGSTGLVGQQILGQALARADVAQVVAPTRRPLGAAWAQALAQGRLLNPVVDFQSLPGQASWWRADAVLCALGTTLKLAGSPAAFRAVDHDHVLAAARCARHAGTPCFVLNSSVGADAGASSFYLRVKGETETDLALLGFDSLTHVRPSLLDGGPRPDKRLGEEIGLVAARWLAPLIPARYRAVRTADVARAMLDAALHPTPGVQIVASERIGA